METTDHHRPPTESLDQDHWVDRYMVYLTVEKGLAPNTLESYSRDLQDFSAYLWDQAVTAIATIRAPVILGYLIHLRNRGLSSKSRARHLVTLRGFFRFLHQEKMIPVDPVALIAMPKSGLHLPGILSVPEIRALLSAPDESRPVGLRDAAMLELLVDAGDGEPAEQWKIASDHFLGVARRRMALLLGSVPILATVVAGIIVWVAISATLGWMWLAVAELIGSFR